MSRTIRNNLNLETGRPEKTRDNKPRCQCCCNPRHSAHGNKKEKLTIQERKEEWLEKANWPDHHNGESICANIGKEHFGRRKDKTL